MGAGKMQLLTKADIANLSVVYGKENVLPWEWYDTVSVPNGNTNTAINFFSNTRGGQGIAVTNMEQPNQLISGKSFVIEELALDVSLSTPYVAGTLADFVAVTHPQASFTLKINQVEYAQGLVKDLIGGGFFGFGTPAANVAYLSPRNVSGYKLNPAIVIPTQTSFSLEFDYATAANPAVAVLLRPKLLGKLIRLTSA